MGMFDNIICHYPLPNPEHNLLTFQTKSFDDPCLMVYIINKKGRLTYLDEEFEFTGDITFYDSVEEEWIEYRAFFLNGQIVSVVPYDRDWDKEDE